MSEAKRYRKKPVEIEAVRARDAFLWAERDWWSMPPWLNEAYESGDVFFVCNPSRIEIRTLEGMMTASLDDWIIRGVAGELYPCKPEIFAATYEEVPK